MYTQYVGFLTAFIILPFETRVKVLYNTIMKEIPVINHKRYCFSLIESERDGRQRIKMFHLRDTNRPCFSVKKKLKYKSYIYQIFA